MKIQTKARGMQIYFGLAFVKLLLSVYDMGLISLITHILLNNTFGGTS
jgi:hypothetical protein